jgi:hypothetical protein
MLKQLLTATALIATTATAGLAQEPLQQAGFDFYHTNANGCGYNVSVVEKDSVGDVYTKVSILCGPYNYDTAKYENETRLNLWVRCKATGNDLIANRNDDGSGTAWENAEGYMARQIADASCGRIGNRAMRAFH